MLSLRVAKPCTKSNSTLEVSLREQPFPRELWSPIRGAMALNFLGERGS